MALTPSKGEHGTCPTKVVRGVVVNADHEGEDETVHSAKSIKVSHVKESRAERKGRMAQEKQDKKDAAANDLDDGESTGSNV